MERLFGKERELESPDVASAVAPDFDAVSSAAPGLQAEVAVTYRGISKRYAAVQALAAVDLDLEAGRVHAFVGENGAGKSTCLGVLAGRIAPTTGEVRVRGEDFRQGDPRAARKAGVVAIYQELTIVPALSAQANVFLGHPLARTGVLRERAMRTRYLALCQEVGVEAVPDRVPAGTLSIAEQQILEIMRALVADAQVILFDEPTASLALHERTALLQLMDRLRRSGITVVFVSHNLDEVLEIADTVTVFREGLITARAERQAWDKGRIVKEMLGDKVDGRLMHGLLEDKPAPVSSRRRPTTAGEPLVRVEGLTVPGTLYGVDLEISGGEILGIGGLVGSGRTTTLRALAGLEPGAKGALWVDGTRRRVPRSVREARRLGVALIPEDRKGQGLVPQMDAMNNVALGNLGRVSRWGVLSRRRMAASAGAAATQFGFDSARIGELSANLSGGNQQKLLLARWRLNPPRVLLADEPTRGIDIGAKAEIMAALERMAEDGLGIVVVSSELEEVCAISDRVTVLTEGNHAATLDCEEAAITPKRIMSAAFNLEADHVPA